MTQDNYSENRKSVGSIIIKPLRKLAVGTVGVFYSIADKTLERVSSIKEDFEDIAAEAQYQNKKCRMKSI